LLEGSSNEEQAVANDAASALLSLPWELMHDGRSFLFQGKNAVRVRRCLPKERAEKARPSSLPIRILLLSPRPEDERAGYIDHRLSARPLVDAIESLGELAELKILNPPTFPQLRKALKEAADAGEPFDVLHFDGHGVYNRERGLGALCFEDPEDSDQTEKRKSELIDAEKMATLVRDHRIPLVFLEACQSASEERPTASVAAKLLDEGVTSVVAMTHSVLVETARRFVTTFYHELAEGKRIGTAMIAGQNALFDEDFRIRVMGAGELRLQDWFVPVLYQEENDPQLVTRLLPEQVQILQTKQRRLSLGSLPDPPRHTFIGRSRELLSLERLLQMPTSSAQSYVVVRGQGGEGKTTLAVEFARWMVRTNRLRRAAFVSLEQYTDARGVLDSLGRQLLPDGGQYSVAHYPDLKEALQPIERALSDHPTLIVLDNLESVLEGPTNFSLSRPSESAPSDDQRQTEVCRTAPTEIFDLCRNLLQAHPKTRVVFTTREPLPAPFDHRHREIVLGALSRDDAIELVGQVMEREGRKPKYDDAGNTPKEITELVEAVNSHARALVLLTPEITHRGVRATTKNLHQLMAELDRKHPGDRENSLYASVELSLGRLSLQARDHTSALAVFHDGAHLGVLGMMLGVDPETVNIMARQLINVGLAEYQGYNHLRLDPALSPYLIRNMSADEHKQMQSRWAEGMKLLMQFLYEQHFENIELAAQMTLLELPNLMAALLWLQDMVTPEEIAVLASQMETPLSSLDRPQALAQAARVREQAAGRLGEINNARCWTEMANIDRLLERGEVQSAYAVARQHLQRCLAAGEDAFPEAKYCIAWAEWGLGRVLRMNGAPEPALQQLAKARLRFQVLADAGNASAEAMVSGAISESGDCLLDLGRWDKATAAYIEAIKGFAKVDDKRSVAVVKMQLGTVRIYQHRAAEALEIYDEVLRIFESLNEPVDAVWHQIGIASRTVGQFEYAERAFRQSLAIKVRQKNRAGEGTSLLELGTLYVEMGRMEDAVKFQRQGADIYIQLHDPLSEGFACNNLALSLVRLKRYDEARRELHRAIECLNPYGHTGQPWTPWSIIYDLEQAAGNPQAAAQARKQALESYLAYRRDGGQSRTIGAQLCVLTVRAIAEKDTNELKGVLAELSSANTTPDSGRLLISKVQAILRGDQDPKLAADPNLSYDDAAELQLLLEALHAK
jgi:tetratricopeptide (TPR) repeat protein